MMIAKLLGLVRVIFKLEALKNAEVWKDRKKAVNILYAVAMAVMVLLSPQYQLDTAEVMGICTGIVALVNVYLQFATRKDKGLKAEGRMYDVIKKRTDTEFGFSDDNGLPNAPYEYQVIEERESGVPLETPHNSVNSGGDGLLGR